MLDILSGIKNEVEEIKKDVAIAVEIGILRSTARFIISRLIQIDPSRTEAYHTALKALGD